MSDSGSEYRKRTVFSAEDTKLLLNCIRSKAHILENSRKSGITPEMKRKVQYNCFKSVVLA